MRYDNNNYSMFMTVGEGQDSIAIYKKKYKEYKEDI